MPTLSKLEWLIVGGSLCVWVLIVAGGHRFMVDDVFFYLRIADALATGHGSTFNEITPTNGYHPLWMVLCVALRALVSDRERLVRALFLACAVLHVATLMLFARLLDRGGITRRWPALLVLGCFLVTLPPGSEFHLSLPLLLVTLGCAAEVFPGAAGWTPYARFGIAAGFAMLARLDNVFFVAAVMLSVGYRSKPPSARLRALLLSGAGAALVLSPYLAWNKLAFGAFVPISGAVKAGAAEPGLAKLGARGLCICLAALSLPFAGLRRTRFDPSLLLAITLGSAAHVTYVAWRMSSVWQWYYAGEIIGASLAASLWAERLAATPSWSHLRPRTRAAVRWTVAASLLAGAMFQRVKELRGTYAGADWYIEAARVIDRTVPVGEAIATTMSPGGLGYYAHRGVFAFDGLTLDYAYHREAARDGLTTYLREHRITHLFTPGLDSVQGRRLVALTRAHGQVESTAYYDGPGGESIGALQVFSSVLGQPLGKFDFAHLRLEQQHFCAADVAIWRLE